MPNIIKTELSQVDTEKASYDLALTYAKSKLDVLIRDGISDKTSAPDHVVQMHYLAEEFYMALGYFGNMTDEYIKHLVDHQ